MVWSHPIGLFANEECNRSDAGWDHATFARGGVFQSGGMRRQASPADSASEAKLVEPSGIVICDAASQYLALPGVGGNLEALKLAEDVERGTFAEDLCAGSDMLPAQEPPHELRRRDWFDLLPQSGDGEAVNSRQQTSLAPFDVISGCASEIAAENGSACFHTKQSLLDLRYLQAEG